MTNRSSESRQLERGQAKKEERKRLKKELKELEMFFHGSSGAGMDFPTGRSRKNKKRGGFGHPFSLLNLNRTYAYYYVGSYSTLTVRVPASDPAKAPPPTAVLGFTMSTSVLSSIGLVFPGGKFALPSLVQT